MSDIEESKDPPAKDSNNSDEASISTLGKKRSLKEFEGMELVETHTLLSFYRSKFDLYKYFTEHKQVRYSDL